MRMPPRPVAGALLLLAALPAQSFTDLTTTTPLSGVPLCTLGTGCGLAAGDFDRDGDQDLVVPGNRGQTIRYFRNNGGFAFSDDSATCGLGNAADARGCAVGDVDNDGDLDLFIANWRSASSLFLNDGSGHFTDVAAARGITHVRSSFSCNFGDYDRDGWLDLYIGNHYGLGTAQEANILYRNTGNGHFVDVTATAGVGDLAPTFASAFMDYDEDGWPDILTINDKGRLPVLPTHLYRNNRDGTFTEIAASVGANFFIDGMGLDYTDAFNDGGVDFYASDTPPDHLFAVWDQATGRYVDATARYGMVANTPAGWACNFFDYDNDGWQDVHVVHMVTANHVFKNPGAPAAANVAWPNVATAIGLAQPWEQFSCLLADFDDDGGIDVCNRYQVSSPTTQAPRGLGLLRNQVVRGNWLKFATVGTVSNRDGIGARIDVVTGNQRQRRWVRSGTGFLGSSDLRLHFGLGGAMHADHVEITWPSGQVQHLTHVAANQVVTVTEPRFALRAPATVGGSTALDLAIGSDAGLAYAMALALTDQPRTALPDGRSLPLTFDALSILTLAPGNAVLPGCQGLLDAQGTASSALNVPALPILHGMTLYATAVTFDPPHFPVVKTVFPQPVRIELP